MATRTTRHFPRFIKLFARETICIADDARDAIEERLARKMREQLRRKTRAMSGIQQNAPSLAHLVKHRIFQRGTMTGALVVTPAPEKDCELNELSRHALPSVLLIATMSPR